MMEYLLAPVLAFIGALLGSWLRRPKKIPLLSYNEVATLAEETSDKVYVTKTKKRINAEDNAIRRDIERSKATRDAAGH